eukprot:7379307-Prymnesium_polylepis.1
MCGYNKINGQYACGSHKVLVDDLKGKMGFEGWVMSDWWAIHDPAASANGVDQEMPGTGDFAPDRMSAEGADPAEMSRRILLGMFMAGAFADPVCSVGQDCWHCASVP